MAQCWCRFGTSLKKHREKRQVADEWPEADGGLFDSGDLDLSELDFSNVFGDGNSGGSLLGSRAHHLVNLLAMPDTCLFRNILHVWDSNVERIRSLDQKQILDDINEALVEGSAQYKSTFKYNYYITLFYSFIYLFIY